MARALKTEKYIDAGSEAAYTMDIMPYAYQQEILDRLEVERTVRVYTRNLVVATLLKYVTDIKQMKGLGFCVSIEHGEFISHYFNEHGIPALFLSGKSSE